MRSVLLTLAVFTATSARVSAQEFGDQRWDWGWGHMMFGGLMMVLLWGGLIVLAVLGVRWMGDSRSNGRSDRNESPPALEALQIRFAHGEIDEAEYEERRRVLLRNQ